MIDAGGPCGPNADVLQIVNAVFNGFQMLMLTFVTAWVSVIKKQNGRRDHGNGRES